MSAWERWSQFWKHQTKSRAVFALHPTNIDKIQFFSEIVQYVPIEIQCREQQFLSKSVL